MPPYEPISKCMLMMKLIELSLACSCMGLNISASSNERNGFILSCIVYGGYIIVFSGMVIGILFKERMSRLVDMFFTLIGMALFVAAGGTNLSYFISYKKYQTDLKRLGLAAGSLSIVNAFILLVDAAFTYKSVYQY